MASSKPVKYNFKEFKKFDPQVSVSRTTLRRSQASLYDLMVSKLDAGDAITYEEAHQIWITKACRNVIDGKPHSLTWRYDHSKEAYTSVLEPMSEDLIKMTVIGWLTRNIGVLVLKGYLKAIPMVQLV